MLGKHGKARLRDTILCRASTVAAVWLLAAMTGCGSFDGQKVRREHAGLFQSSSRELTEHELEGRKSLTLGDCIAIALRNNLQVRMAEIQGRIAHMDRLVSFAAFLPMVEATGGLTAVDRQPMLRFSALQAGQSMFIPMQDRTVGRAALQAQIPIFRPSTWFLYRASQRGEETGALLQEYTQQRIRIEVTSQYFNCLSLRESKRSVGGQITASRQLQAEIEARHAQGLAEDWEVEQVRNRVLAYQIEQERFDRAEAAEEADLMSLMGLSPLARCTLAGPASLQAPSGDVAELTAQALLSHPQLHVADRDVAISREQVKVAIAGFLPDITATLGGAYSSDSYLKYSTWLSGGLSGVMTVFNGFANVNQYRIAREREEETWLRREECCLSVIVQVTRAHASLRDAERDVELAAKNLGVAVTRLAVAGSKWHEGLASSADLLEAVAACDLAASDYQCAKFRQQVCIAALLHAMGRNCYPAAGQEQAQSTQGR